MKKTRRACLLAVNFCILCTASIGSYAKSPVAADPFSASSWAAGTPVGSAQLTVHPGNQHIAYTAGGGTPNPEFQTLNWLSYGPDGSWTFEMVVSMPSLATTGLTNQQFADFGLRAMAAAPDKASLAIFVQDVNRGLGPNGVNVEERRFRVVSTGRKNGDIDELNDPGLHPAALSAIRLRFDAATGHLFADFDPDTANGLQWVPFGDLAHQSFALGEIQVFGQSGPVPGQTLQTGPQITAENQIFGEKIQVVPEPSTYASLLAGLGVLLCLALRGRPKAA